MRHTIRYDVYGLHHLYEMNHLYVLMLANVYTILKKLDVVEDNNCLDTIAMLRASIQNITFTYLEYHNGERSPGFIKLLNPQGSMINSFGPATVHWKHP